jgi:hypothetical protein
MPAKLVGLRGTLVGQTVSLADETTIGREAGNAVHVDDQTVGRKHARIVFQGDEYVLEDLSSQNGTFVNDARVTRTTLKPGDAIQFGGQLFRFEEATVAAPPRGEVGRTESAVVAPPRSGETPGLFRTTGIISDSGCANINLEGCLRWLIIMLIALVVLTILALVIGGLLGGLGGLAGGSGNASPGSQVGGGGSAPPVGGAQQEGQSDEEETQGGPVRIVDVRMDFAQRPGHTGLVPVVLVTWQNVGDKPLTQVQGRIIGYGPNGERVGEIPNTWIYSGEPVPPGAEHSDTVQQGGVVAEPAKTNSLKRAPKTAKVLVLSAR